MAIGGNTESLVRPQKWPGGADWGHGPSASKTVLVGLSLGIYYSK